MFAQSLPCPRLLPSCWRKGVSSCWWCPWIPTEETAPSSPPGSSTSLWRTETLGPPSLVSEHSELPCGRKRRQYYPTSPSFQHSSRSDKGTAWVWHVVIRPLLNGKCWQRETLLYSLISPASSTTLCRLCKENDSPVVCAFHAEFKCPFKCYQNNLG